MGWNLNLYTLEEERTHICYCDVIGILAGDSSKDFWHPLRCKIPWVISWWWGSCASRGCCRYGRLSLLSHTAIAICRLFTMLTPLGSLHHLARLYARSCFTRRVAQSLQLSACPTDLFLIHNTSRTMWWGFLSRCIVYALCFLIYVINYHLFYLKHEGRATKKLCLNEKTFYSIYSSFAICISTSSQTHEWQSQS